jgi:glycine betaine/proline transport system substrate-binding protein
MFLLFAAACICFIPAIAFSAEHVTFADLSWDSIQLHNRIAGFIFEHGYGKKVDYLFVDITPGLMGLERGDIDINMELWPTYNIEWWDKAREKGTVVDMGVNYGGATQGWYVPTYVIKGDPERGIDPMASGLRAVDDLSEYWEIFRDPEHPKKGRFINGPTGWVAHDINLAKLEGYGLDRTFHPFSPGSGTALDTTIVTAYELGRPVLFYYWEPTWILGKFDMTRLEEPPYDEKLWNSENKFLCTWLTATTYVVANSDFVRDNPVLAEVLRKYSTSLDQNQKALAWLQENGSDIERGAVWFLREYPEVWKSWIRGNNRESVIHKIQKALEQ